MILYPGVQTPLRDKGPEDIDFVVVRENTEGLYAGGGGFLRKGTPHEIAVQESINTRMGVERCIRYAFDYCRKRKQKKETDPVRENQCVDLRLRHVGTGVLRGGQGVSDIETDYAHVDATSMWMIKNPEWFDVIVTDNMFGDIITDIGAIIQGGLGIAAGGNINPEGVSMFEPIGGSAPKYTGKNMINPLACILAAQLMLAHLNEDSGARRIESAVMKVVANDVRDLSVGKMGKSTSEIGDLVARYIQDDDA